MTEDGDELEHYSVDDAGGLSESERSLIAALRAPAPVDAAEFDARVMSAVRHEPRHGAKVRSRQLRRIAGISIATAALAAAAAFMVSDHGDAAARARQSRAQSARATVPSTAAPSSRRDVLFTLVTSGASRVAIAGSFNGWNAAATPLRQVGKDTWEAEIPLGAGRYVYQFVIDGTRWVPDPEAPRDAGDDFGSSNSVVTVASSGSA